MRGSGAEGSGEQEACHGTGKIYYRSEPGGNAVILENIAVFMTDDQCIKDDYHIKIEGGVQWNSGNIL